MTIHINQSIVGYAVVPNDAVPVQPTLAERPEMLLGRTYKVKTPLSEHALYVTINDKGGRPFEIFINSKAMEHFQWIVALTRMISAIFRKGGDVTFIMEEMRSVCDPKGGYFAKGRYIPSLVAEIGGVIEQHLVGLGMVNFDDSLAVAARAMVAEKETATVQDAALCPKCNTVAVKILDGCATCLNCGDSKCG